MIYKLQFQHPCSSRIKGGNNNDFTFQLLINCLYGPHQANLCLQAFRHDKFQLRMPSHSEGPGIWLSVWRFLLTHCLYERAAKVLARRLAWTFAARIGDKYQIRLTRSIYKQSFDIPTRDNTHWYQCKNPIIQNIKFCPQRAMSWQNLFMSYENNKDTDDDQPVHLCSLILVP